MLKTAKRITAFALLLLLALNLFSCKENKKIYSYVSYEFFNSFTVIDGYANSKSEFDGIVSVLEEKLSTYHKLFDIYNLYEGMNNAKTINDNAGGSEVTVSPELIDLLLFSVDVADYTKGKNNIAMGSVLKLWHDCRERANSEEQFAELPLYEDLKEAYLHTDINKIKIDKENCTVKLLDKDMSIDLGSVAKGFVCDRLADYLSENGYTGYALNIGGNVKTIGTKANGSKWVAGIQNPQSDGVICNVALAGESLVTSGSYQRFYEVDGKRYHHIIDPDTLYPKNDFLSVSVFSKSSVLADAMSTALFNMTYEEGRALADSDDRFSAMWILSDGSIYKSNGFISE